jgi:biopolymer transport protein ExbD
MHHRHRQKDTGEEGGVNLSIIITPMLDMAFQLMAFFIMTYHPSALEGHFDIKLLPPSKIATKGPVDKQDGSPVTDEEPQFQDVLMVRVKAVAKKQKEGSRTEGDPSRILLIRPEDANNPALIADSDVTFEEGLTKLRVELKKFLDNPTNSNANIKIEPDADLKHRYTMAVYDACKVVNPAAPQNEQVGFKNVQFVGPAIERKKDDD